MAQQSYRANLSAAIYPMALSRAGRSVIVPQIDQNYDRRVDPTGEQKTPGIPQALYLENVLPTVEGYASVGYKNLASLPFTGSFGLLEIDSAEDEPREIVIFRIGALEAWRWTGTTWAAITLLNTSGAINFSDPAKFSFAVIRDFILIFDGDTLWSYFPGTPSMSRIDSIGTTTGTIAPAGAMDDLVAITASNGYHIFLKDTGSQISVLWSSLLDVLDFTPSLTTGAGGGALQEAQGRAVTVSPVSGGFYAYNTSNILEATYTGNSRYPFRFRPVIGAEGLQRKQALYSTLTDSGPIYMNRFFAITQIKGNQATQQASELTEFLERFTSVDVFDYATNTFSRETVTLEAFDNTSPYLYAGRYVCVSVRVIEQLRGIQPFNYVYVFDSLLNRYGRMRVDHTHIVHAYESSTQDYMGFLNARTGTFVRWNFDAALVGGLNYLPFTGVLLLGRFQGVRSRRICLEELDLESASENKADCSVVLLPSENGKTFLPAVTPYEKAESTAEVKQYYAHTDSKNLCVLVKGAFDISTLELKFHLGGDA